METDNLIRTIQKLRKRPHDPAAIAQLSERKRKELEFHNLHRDPKTVETVAKDTYELMYGNKKYYSTVQLSRQYIHDWLAKHVPGKVFLDYACGNGEMTRTAARLGTKLAIGLDISDVSVANGQRAAREEGLDNCLFVQGDCEKTGLPDESVDVILCSGMLHHLDLSYAFPELRRILKKGGVILALEALDYNPLIKIYRNLTPAMRTDWEKNHILSMKDLEFAERFFRVEEVRFWHLSSVAAAYIRSNASVQRRLLAVLDKVDSFLLRLPLIKLMSWQFTFELHRPVED